MGRFMDFNNLYISIFAYSNYERMIIMPEKISIFYALKILEEFFWQ